MNRPVEKAIELIDNYCIEKPSQLVLEEIANAEYLIVLEATLQNELGRIVYNEDYGLIKISNTLKDTGIRRFTLAHEIGHYCISRSRKFMKHGCTIDSVTGLKSNVKAEQEANEFAAELLMHKPWFSDFIHNRPVSLDLIKETAAYFNVSLTAAAVRYAEIGQFPIAVIMSKEGKVAWSYINEYFPVKFIPKNYTVQKTSRVYDYFAGKTINPGSDLVLCNTWFGSDYNSRQDIYFYEDNLPMPNYKSVLTILWQYEY